MTNSEDECLKAYREYNKEKVVGDVTYITPDPPKDPSSIANWGLERSKRKFPSYPEMVELSNNAMVRYEKSLTTEEYEELVYTEQDRLEDGFFFYNGDKLEYVVGFHYIMLQWFVVPDAETGDSKKPSFIDAQRDGFYHYQWCDENPTLGAIWGTSRRWGKSLVAVVIAYLKAVSNFNAKVAIQSKSDADAEVLFGKLAEYWQKMPQFLKPTDTGDSRVKNQLVFAEPKRRSTKSQIKEYGVQLNSRIFSVPAYETALDGQRLTFLIQDESGKCFGKGTKIRMFNGSVKNIEDIEEGELVMGADSTKRVVSDVVSGTDEMFEIHPKKGESWTCNKSHTLSLKWCTKTPTTISGIRYFKGDVINISVGDYLELNDNQKKHTVLYRNSIEYKEVCHEIEPYFIGLWIGDGSRGSLQITNVDKEVIDYLSEFATSHNVNFISDSDKSHRLSKTALNVFTKKDSKDNIIESYESEVEVRKAYGFKGRFEFTNEFKNNNWTVIKGKNELLNKFKKLNLLKNKHIPSDYMLDSMDNRLQLLAGLIDSDGYNGSVGNKYTYEIVQKRKDLSYQIYDLIKSCGFGSSINQKTATMKREDGSVYKCEVYRITIYGDLWKIPCKIKRKQVAEIKTHHKNRRNPNHTGFNIKSIGIGNYYGFAVDKDSLFLLEDYTVVHNCERNDVNERWNINSKCLLARKNIVGKSLHISTVEDMVKRGGENFKKIWDKSDKKTMDDVTNRTSSGLRRFFIPADYGFEVDEFGYSDRSAARRYHEAVMSKLSGSDLISYKRQYPLEESDMWMMEDAGCKFSLPRLYQQTRYNEENEIHKTIRTGNLFWKNGQRFEGVVFDDDPNGRFRISYMPKPEHQCKYTMVDEHRRPSIPYFRIGVDPTDSYSPSDGKGSRNGLYVVAMPSSLGFKSITPICEYSHRHDSPNDFYEDVLLLAAFYSAPVLVERNRGGGLIGAFEVARALQYIMKDPREKDPRKKKWGMASTGEGARNTLMGRAQAYVVENVGYLSGTDSFGDFPFTELIEDMIDFTPTAQDSRWLKWDMVVAFMYALEACEAEFRVIDDQEYQFNMGDFLNTYKIR